MIGETFGPFNIICEDIPHPQRWLAKCSLCGIERSFPEHRLAKDQGFVCACQKGAKGMRFQTVNIKHGMSHEPIYAVWGAMKTRCFNKNMPAYAIYGGRGITICERWLEFSNFYEDMGTTYRKGLSLDRINNDGNYEPSNCYWATMAQQNRNQSSNVYIDTCRGRMTMQDAAKLAGLTWRGMLYRVTKGVSGEELFAPAKVHRRAA